MGLLRDVDGGLMIRKRAARDEREGYLHSTVGAGLGSGCLLAKDLQLVVMWIGEKTGCSRIRSGPVHIEPLTSWGCSSFGSPCMEQWVLATKRGEQKCNLGERGSFLE